MSDEQFINIRLKKNLSFIFICSNTDPDFEMIQWRKVKTALKRSNKFNEYF